MSQNQFLASVGFRQENVPEEAPGRYPEYPDLDLKLQKLRQMNPAAPEIAQVVNTLEAARQAAAAGDLPHSRGAVYDAGVQLDNALLKYGGGGKQIWVLLGIAAAFTTGVIVAIMLAKRKRRRRNPKPREEPRVKKPRPNDEDDDDDDDEEDDGEEEEDEEEEEGEDGDGEE